MEPSDYGKWINKRHLGLRVSWNFTQKVELNTRYTEENKEFIRLANVIHEQGVTEEMRELMQEIKREKMQCNPECKVHSCTLGKVSNYSKNIIDQKYGNISVEPIHKNEITEESLGAFI